MFMVKVDMDPKGKVSVRSSHGATHPKAAQRACSRDGAFGTFEAGPPFCFTEALGFSFFSSFSQVFLKCFSNVFLIYSHCFTHFFFLNHVLTTFCVYHLCNLNPI